jgi:outer membrane protein OmpA-like peptidoglycan-associated protein
LWFRAFVGVLMVVFVALALAGCCRPCQCPECQVCPACPTIAATPPPQPTCMGGTYEEWIDLGGTRILFPNGAATLDAEARRLLDEAVATVRTRTDVLRVRVRGHTDSRGPDASNQALSQQRSDAVVQYLASLGIPATMLESTAMGSSQPLADESSASERELNRRVDFQVLVRRCRDMPVTPSSIR